MRKAYVALAVAALVAAAAIGFGTDRAEPPMAELSTGSAGGRAAAGFGTSAAGPITAGVAPAPSPAAAVQAPASEPPPAPLGSGEPPDLRVDEAGRLVVDSRTRDELEKLLALNDRAESLALLSSLETKMPPVAYREALNAYYAFQGYLAGLPQVSMPAQPTTNEHELATQLEALHALRVQTLGAQTAVAYFGEEEAFSRKLIAWMQANPMPGATLDEKAARAQEAVAKKP